MKFAVQLAQWFQRRYLKTLTNDGQSKESLVYYKLTHEPSATMNLTLIIDLVNDLYAD